MHFDVLRFKSWTWRHSDASGYSSWHLDAIASAPGASAQGGLGMCKAQFSANRENQVLQAPDFHRLSLFVPAESPGRRPLSVHSSVCGTRRGTVTAERRTRGEMETSTFCDVRAPLVKDFEPHLSRVSWYSMVQHGTAWYSLQK